MYLTFTRISTLGESQLSLAIHNYNGPFVEMGFLKSGVYHTYGAILEKSLDYVFQSVYCIAHTYSCFSNKTALIQ